MYSVRIHLAQPAQTHVEGIIYVTDPITNILVLNTSAQAQTSGINSTSLIAPAGSYRLIPISQITSFQILSLGPQTSNENTKSTAPVILDTAALNSRLQRSIHTAQQAQARQGPKGTTAVDQAVFDALSRQYQTRWQGTAIIINDQFIIDKPYDGTNVKLMASATGDLERMKKIIMMEKSKAELKQPMDGTISSTTGSLRGTPFGNQRKGG